MSLVGYVLIVAALPERLLGVAGTPCSMIVAALTLRLLGVTGRLRSYCGGSF